MVAKLVRVGPAGWSYPDWEGPVYPRPHPRDFHPLAFLARYVECVELNTTFYALPQARHAARWAGLVAEHPTFRFLAKLHRSFTHEPGAEVPGAEADAFRGGVRPLAEAGRLAALLAQFPVSFHRTAGLGRAWLGWRTSSTAPALVLELRHRSWFTPESIDELEQLGVGLAHIDLPAAPDHPPPVHPTLGAVGYVRLHGRNDRTWFDPKAGRDDRYDYLYGRDELAAITDRIRRVAAHGRETFLVTNNHYGGQAVANALEIRGPARRDGRPSPRRRCGGRSPASRPSPEPRDSNTLFEALRRSDQRREAARAPWRGPAAARRGSSRARAGSPSGRRRRSRRDLGLHVAASRPGGSAGWPRAEAARRPRRPPPSPSRRPVRRAAPLERRLDARGSARARP